MNTTSSPVDGQDRTGTDGSPAAWADHTLRDHMYAAILEEIFVAKFKEGITQVDFQRSDITAAAKRLGLRRPSNVGDVVYSARYRGNLPESVQSTATAGREWIIRGTGTGRYSFVLARPIRLAPNQQMGATKVPDATPGVVAMHALSDEQALLAIVRYNRLIDIFTGITCYSLQNHIRTAVRGIGQVETDELYVGVDTKGCHYVIPVQAKGGRDALNIVQIEQDMALWCARLTGEGQPVEVRRKEGVTNHFRPESCAGRCEAAGEALTGARTGRAIEHRKRERLERRDCHSGRRQHRHYRNGEGMAGSCARLTGEG